ncbi:GspH/FimT family pseudopilin [Verminephrobacter aporrectodeae]|uniref:GspH/FimT family pseudopilin n=1 Tax=Verminephrobacter aporrectodeae TaxID=1110389 RepID=UPI002244DEDA|nr:GspH/FimT family pseudopilin [Verminephrobacter aporrectodeae]
MPCEIFSADRLKAWHIDMLDAGGHRTRTLLAMGHAGQRIDRGWTLIDLLLSVALAAVLMGLAAPSLVQYQRNSELSALTNTLLASINAARWEALKTGKNAFVRPRGTGWNSGWVVYVDANRDSVYTHAADITVQVQGAVKSHFNVTGNNTAAGASPYVKFDSSGYSTNLGGAPVALSLSIARTDVPPARVREETRRIVVARTGRVRTCKPGHAGCPASTTRQVGAE